MTFDYFILVEFSDSQVYVQNKFADSSGFLKERKTLERVYCVQRCPMAQFDAVNHLKWSEGQQFTSVLGLK